MVESWRHNFDNLKVLNDTLLSSCKSDYNDIETNLPSFSDIESGPYSTLINTNLYLPSFALKFIEPSSDEEEQTQSQTYQEMKLEGKTSFYDEQEIEKGREVFFETLTHYINEEVFEYGTENYADLYVQESIYNNRVAKEWLNAFFNHHFDDEKILTSILRIISNIDYDCIKPTGPSMALSVLNHKNPEVQECSIRAFENWGDEDSLTMLKYVKCSEDWLQSYLNQVICDLEEIVNGVSCEKN